ncbi:MAG: penicillin-binding protein 1A [Betaproteobacteria bacterium]|nr:penicillin-binding protein 1A [Betaproteobacteria bacterium]
MMRFSWTALLAGAFGLALGLAALLLLAVAIIYPSLPSLEALTDYRPKMPLRIYSEEGVLIGEFGEERRAVVHIDKVPAVLRQAVLAAEDERFYSHGGIDTLGILRAAVANLVSGEVREGASTITMQVARNFFLSSERSFRRKINEALLAIKIEHQLSKDEILELYLNHIYLGQRAYGFAAASRIYFGKPLDKITVAEAAMLAGLPKAPSAYNPVVNPARAKVRQLYVLGRMHSLDYIDDATYEQAKAQRLGVRYSPQNYEAVSDHLAEMVRQYMHKRYGDQIYVSGMKVYTTLRAKEQRAAVEAVRLGLVEFNRRHGYIGPEGQLKLPKEAEARDKAIFDTLSDLPEANGLLPAVVLQVAKDTIRIRLRNGEDVELGASEVKFAQAAIAAKKFAPGAIVRAVRLSPDHAWQLTYLPRAEAALVAISPDDGAIRALVGGFDFARNQYNHVAQAWRQPGSSFKPFVYSAALEKGITPATVFDDAPVSVDPALTGGEQWDPKNYDGTMDGPITLRTALYKSKNLVSIRVLQAAGLEFTREYAARFGFDIERLPPYFTMALGASEVTPLQMVSAYAVFASGGHQVKPYFLRRVTDKDGQVLEDYKGIPANTAPPIIDPRNAFIMTSLMQDVVRRGTATAALRLGRSDLAGKTGTTNDHRDAWFSGFNPSRVAVAWVGYDQPRPLGRGETGGVTALPIWMHYMAEALRGQPDAAYAMPDGVVPMRVDPKTGVPDPDGAVEYFMQEFAPGKAGPDRISALAGRGA